LRLALALVYLLAATASVVAAVVLVRRRAGSAGLWLALVILASGFWAALDALDLQLATVAAKRLLSQIQYPAIVSVAPCFFHAAAALARAEARIHRGIRLAVWLIPVLTVAVAWTSHWHVWLWREITIPNPSTNLGVYEYGWWFWVFAFHAYILLAVATLILLAATRRVTRPFRVPLAAVLLAVVLPWFGNIAYVFKLGPMPGLNWFSISLLASGCILAWITAQKALLDLLPHAREALVDSMQDAVIVSDGEDGVVYANTAARTLLWGRAAARELPAPLRAAGRRNGETGIPAVSWHGEVQLVIDDVTHWLDLRVDPVRDRWNEIAGRLLVWRDISERKSLEAEKDRLITDLAGAINRVKKLQAILPTCAGCRKIRDDDNTWTPLDSYVERHAGVAFSHGFCPECMTRLYGDYLDE
jgi:PAS domain-containing protein